MRRKLGFTLVEVVAALAIGGMVVLIAQQLFASTSQAGHVLVQSRATLDRQANAARWLRATLLSIEVSPATAGGFAGGRNRASFASWQETGDGWFAPRHITLLVVGSRLVAVAPPSDSLVLLDSVNAVDFDYLLATGAESHWIREWVSGVSAPLAVRLRIARLGTVDTLLLLIKERG